MGLRERLSQIFDRSEQDFPSGLNPTSFVISSWGFFNPMGPTVGRIVMRTVNDRVRIDFFQHHDISPDSKELFSMDGRRTDPDVMKAAQDAIRTAICDDESIIGSGPSYLVVHDPAFASCIRDGYIARMVRIESADWMNKEAKDLLKRPDKPWERATEALQSLTRSSSRDRVEPESTESRRAAERLWSAITHPKVVAGIVPEMTTARALAQVSLDELLGRQSRGSRSRETSSPSRGRPGVPSDRLGIETLEALRTTLYMDEEWIEQSERQIVWTAGASSMVLTVSEPFVKYGDEAVKFTAECTFIEQVTAEDDVVLAEVDRLNRLGSVGSFVWNPDRRTISVYNSDYPHAGNESLSRFRSAFLLLSYSEAMSSSADSIASMVGGSPVSLRWDQDELLDFTDLKVIPAGTEPLQWDEDEMEGMEAFVGQMGLDGYSDRRRMSVEVPFTGTVSQLSIMRRTGRAPSSAPMTSLYEQHLSGVAHHRYGIGLWASLRLPPMMHITTARRLANRLNSIERDETTGFASWGAWVATEDGLAHRAFFPNLYGTTGLLTTIAGYAVMRGQWISELAEEIESVAAEES